MESPGSGHPVSRFRQDLRPKQHAEVLRDVDMQKCRLHEHPAVSTGQGQGSILKTLFALDGGEDQSPAEKAEERNASQDSTPRR